MAAYLFLADRRRERELAELLSVELLGQGSGEAASKQIQAWLGEQ
jgi:hypothetical protein